MKHYFSTINEDGRWSFSDCEGHRFISIGVDCVTPPDINIITIAKKYGGYNEWLSKWAESKLQCVKGLGFNTLGSWHHNYYWGNGFPKTVEVRMSKYAKKVNNEWNFGFPDVFDDSFEESIQKAFIDLLGDKGKHLYDDIGLIGYYTDNELHWWGSGGYWGDDNQGGGMECTALVDDYISQDKDTAAKKAWVKFIQSQYDTIERLNDEWGSEYTDFEELLHCGFYRAKPEVLQKNKTEFLRLIAERYFQKTSEYLKKYDPCRLNLGCRFVGISTPRVVLEVMKKYVDVLSINFYNTVFPEKYLSQVYDITGKPLMITEFSFCAGKRAGFSYSTNGARSVIVKDQVRRGECYRSFLSEASTLDYVIGMHWFALYDYGHYDSLIGNYGLFDLKDNLWTDFADAVKNTNITVRRRRE